jgi:hypothetical protein
VKESQATEFSRNYLRPNALLAQTTGGNAMREREGYVTCAVATANGFAQTYRTKIVVHQDKPESSVMDLDSAALRESLAARHRGLPEKPDANS